MKKILNDILPNNIISFGRKAYYYGSKHYCPCCKNSFRYFFPGGLDIPVIKEKKVVGAGYKYDYLCPVCISTDRERLLMLYLKLHTNIFKDKIKLLHVAPEINVQRAFFQCTTIEYVSADLDSPLAMVKMDITNIQYPTDYFDVIICNHVLEHVPDDTKAIAELFRVLRPGGWGILQVPIAQNLEKTYEDFSITSAKDKETHFGQIDHVRIYAKDYEIRLTNSGFQVDKFFPDKMFSKADLKKYSIDGQEVIYVVRKN